MCRSEWEMEKRKSKGSGWCLTFGLSSHLFFLLSFLWVLSSSFLTLSQPHMSAKCSVSSWRHLFAVQNVTTVLPLNMGVVGLSAVVKYSIGIIVPVIKTTFIWKWSGPMQHKQEPTQGWLKEPWAVRSVWSAPVWDKSISRLPQISVYTYMWQMFYSFWVHCLNL